MSENLLESAPLHAHLVKEDIRKIKFKNDIPKGLWYSPLAGKEMLVHLFSGYEGAKSVSMPDNTSISSEYFDLVKYVDEFRNDDIRLTIKKH